MQQKQGLFYKLSCASVVGLHPACSLSSTLGILLLNHSELLALTPYFFISSHAPVSLGALWSLSDGNHMINISSLIDKVIEHKTPQCKMQQSLLYHVSLFLGWAEFFLFNTGYLPLPNHFPSHFTCPLLLCCTSCNSAPSVCVHVCFSFLALHLVFFYTPDRRHLTLIEDACSGTRFPELESQSY